MLVTIKWDKKVFENVEIDISLGVDIFKTQIFSLTGLLRYFLLFNSINYNLRCSSRKTETYG